MVEIIPAINVDNFEEVRRRIKLVEPHSSWVQIDVADGIFTKNTIWHNPQELALIKTPLYIEVHLMINDIERRIEDWLLPNVKRLIFHIEASHDPDLVIEKCREAGKEVGIAISPGTSWVRLAHFKDKVDLFQILGVDPGLAGQEIKEETFEKIRELKKICNSCIIEVDGGMNKETAKKAVEAGADVIAAASSIFGQDDVGKAIEELKEVVNPKH